MISQDIDVTRQKLEQATSAKELAKVEGHESITLCNIVCMCVTIHVLYTHTHTLLMIVYYCVVSWCTNTRE